MDNRKLHFFIDIYPKQKIIKFLNSGSYVNFLHITTRKFFWVSFTTSPNLRQNLKTHRMAIMKKPKFQNLKLWRSKNHFTSQVMSHFHSCSFDLKGQSSEIFDLRFLANYSCPEYISISFVKLQRYKTNKFIPNYGIPCIIIIFHGVGYIME